MRTACTLAGAALAGIAGWPVPVALYLLALVMVRVLRRHLSGPGLVIAACTWFALTGAVLGLIVRTVLSLT